MPGEDEVVPSGRHFVELDTRSTAASARAGSWNEAIQRASVPLAVYSRGENGFAGRLRADLIGDLRLLTIKADAQTVVRTPQLVGSEDEPAFYKLVFHAAGWCRVQQDGRTAELEERALVLYDTTRPYRMDFLGPYRHHVLMVPREVLGVPLEAVARVTAVPVPVSQGAARVLIRMMASLGADIQSLGERHRLTIAETLVELATAVVQEVAWPALSTKDSGQFAEILAFVEHHLADQRLTPQVIASAHFMSLRSLQMLFQSRDESPSSWIRKRRLENSRRDLIRTQEPISVVAVRWGFPDPASFTRSFKRAFGVAPATYRAGYSDATARDGSSPVR
ncbi:MAG: helix-turn-helix domain-containing protein [Microbacteriaceae bacterium]